MSGQEAPGQPVKRMSASEAATTCVSTIKGLIKKAARALPDDSDLMALQNILKLAFLKEDDYIVRRMTPRIWKFRKEIDTRDEVLFSPEFGQEFIQNDQRKGMLTRMLKTIKKLYADASTQEKDELWTDIRQILRCVAHFLAALPKNEAEDLIAIDRFNDDDDDDEQ